MDQGLVQIKEQGALLVAFIFLFNRTISVVHRFVEFCEVTSRGLSTLSQTTTEALTAKRVLFIFLSGCERALTALTLNLTTLLTLYFLSNTYIVVGHIKGSQDNLSLRWLKDAEHVLQTLKSLNQVLLFDLL